MKASEALQEAQRILDMDMHFEQIRMGSPSDFESYGIIVRLLDGTVREVKQPEQDLEELLRPDPTQAEAELAALQEQEEALILRKSALVKLLDKQESEGQDSDT